MSDFFSSFCSNPSFNKVIIELPPPSAPSIEKVEEPKGGFVKVDPPRNSKDADIMSAHNQIMSYFRSVQALSDVMSKQLNPPSVNKTLIGRLTGPKAGDLRTIKLTREQKNDILVKSRALLDKFNMFMFDYNRYAKSLPERQYNEIAIVLGEFMKNLDKFVVVVIKSETVKESLEKLKSTFSCINIDFQQKISYQNNGSQTASFDHHQTIQDTGVSTLQVDRDY